MLKAVTSSFIALIPKKDNPQSLSDYGPISLIVSMHKIISKLLALRVKKVLGSVISPCQTTFMPGRIILDEVVVTNELIDYVKFRNRGCFLFKIDLGKAYDSVCWSFLDYMMRPLGFDPI